MQVVLATEDALSEAIGMLLLSELSSPVVPNLRLRKQGFGYLRSNMSKWRALAQSQVVLLLTDLDDKTCPMSLKTDWTGSVPLPSNLMLRIAVREVESWVLADHDALRELIGNKGAFPHHPDTLAEPKQYLLNLARRAPRNIREDLIVERGAAASQGLGYNNVLVDWIQSKWNPERAASRSPSLRRMRERLREMASKD